MEIRTVRGISAGPSLEGPFSFYQLSVIAFQLAAYAFMSLEGPKTHGSPPPDPVLEILDIIKNRLVFKIVFKA